MCISTRLAEWRSFETDRIFFTQRHGEKGGYTFRCPNCGTRVYVGKVGAEHKCRTCDLLFCYENGNILRKMFTEDN